MSSLGKLVVRAGLIALFSAMPLAAQVPYGVKFTTPFSFYVGNVQMPSGSYEITQPENLNNAFVLIKSADGLRGAFIGITPTQTLEPPLQSKVVFEKYGDSLYFDRVILQGDTNGILADTTKAEKKVEERASAVEERSISAVGE
jgi:hypothetical protein